MPPFQRYSKRYPLPSPKHLLPDIISWHREGHFLSSTRRAQLLMSKEYSQSECSLLLSARPAWNTNRWIYLFIYSLVLNWWPFCSYQHERLHLATDCAGLTSGKHRRESVPLEVAVSPHICSTSTMWEQREMTKLRKVWDLYQMCCGASRDFLHPIAPYGSLHWTLLTLWLGRSPPWLGSAKG